MPLSRIRLLINSQCDVVVGYYIICYVVSVFGVQTKIVIFTKCERLIVLHRILCGVFCVLMDVIETSASLIKMIEMMTMVTMMLKAVASCSCCVFLRVLHG